MWRLLFSPFADGPTNMAVDEAILLAVADGHAPPTLRFFGWVPPCLSLGYAQPIADVDLERLHVLGWGLVRRPTGGRAILHTDELTYSIIAPMTEPRVLGGVVESYRQLSAGLLRGLEILGLQVRADKKADDRWTPVKPRLHRSRPTTDDSKHSAVLSNPSSAVSNPVCFEVPSDYEITAGDKKLLGSAQVRKRGVVLQHGTLPLTGDLTRICQALQFESDEARRHARTRVQQRATHVVEVCGREVTWAEAAAAMARGFAEALGLSFFESGLSDWEQKQAAKLREEKYAVDGWNYRT